MIDETDYISINKQSWNNRTDVHVNSDFYDVEGFKKGRTSLNDTEIELLGDIEGKTLLHLQCHFGQDTISLARMGAITTGVDLSDKSIQYAQELSQNVNVDSSFICCDIYDLPNHLNEKFDIVFTSYGTIGWLPDLDNWANIVSRFLKPRGHFILVEFHPVIWMYDTNVERISYSYFNTGPIIESNKGTYTDKDANIKGHTVTWNHGIGEVVNSLIKNGLRIESLDEFNYSPYNCFENTVEFEPNKFRIKQMGDKIPMVYSLKASKE